MMTLKMLRAKIPKTHGPLATKTWIMGRLSAFLTVRMSGNANHKSSTILITLIVLLTLIISNQSLG